MRHVFLLALALSSGLAVAASAAAQGSDPGAAAELFRAGREAAKRGDYSAACPKLADSFRLDAAVGTLLNLADCEEHLGRIASAWAHFQQATEKLGARDDRLPIAKSRVAALEPRLPHLTIALGSGAPRDAVVLRDGVELGEGSVNVALPVDPGAHHIVVRAASRRERSFDVTIGEREQKRIEVEPGEPTAEPSGGRSPPHVEPSPPAGSQPAVATGPTRGGELRTIGFVVGGAGLVGIGVAVATGLMLPGKQRTVDEHCNAATNHCDAEGYDAAQSGKTLAGINTVAWFAGAIVTGVGVGLVLFGGPKRADAPSAVALTAHPGGARIGGTFR